MHFTERAFKGAFGATVIQSRLQPSPGLGPGLGYPLRGEKHTDGVYLVWYGGHHITIIESGVCHEFNISPKLGGYKQNDPWSDRSWPDEKYTVREITYRP